MWIVHPIVIRLGMIDITDPRFERRNIFYTAEIKTTEAQVMTETNYGSSKHYVVFDFSVGCLCHSHHQHETMSQL